MAMEVLRGFPWERCDFMRSIQRSVLCLLLFGASAGASFALAPQDRSWQPRAASRVESPARPGFLAALQELLIRAWARNGCEIDPLGRCQPNQAPAANPPAGDAAVIQGDNGCEIDPAGRCITAR